jgi:hypothetical protein
MARKKATEGVGIVYKEPVALPVKRTDGVIQRITIRHTENYVPAGTYVPKGGKTPKTFFIKLAAVEILAWQQQIQDLYSQPPPEENVEEETSETKPDVVRLTLHFHNQQSHSGHSPMFLSGFIQKYVLRDNIEREMENLEYQVKHVLGNTGYAALVGMGSSSSGIDWLVYGEEEVEEAGDENETPSHYDVLKYQYKSGERGILHHRTYEMGKRLRDG